jgi:predicted PurR-regulated permease PerM
VVTFDGANVWRSGLVVIALVALALMLRFLISDGGSVLLIVLLAWFLSLAMEPAVRVLARRMRRGAATAVVMLTVAVFVLLFLLAFGQLLRDQVATLIQALPDLARRGLAALNARIGTRTTVQDLIGQIDVTPSQVATYASRVVGGVLGLLGALAGGIFSAFTLLLFTYYLSADGPRLRLWIASLMPPRWQPIAVSVWDITAQKTGGYVSARLVLALVNSTFSAIVFLLIGMPSWLALALWTGIVAQFVPTIGTYIAITLPVLVGLLTPTPWIGVAALVWSVIYQQVENVTIEPRISAKAVNVHPAVAFGAVMLGAALFGPTGALLAVPVIAMLLSLAETYRKRYEVLPSLRAAPPTDAARDGATIDSDGRPG